MSKLHDRVSHEAADLAQQPERDIDFSDMSETSAADWKNAVRGQFYRPLKEQLTVRIDADVVAWLKRDGKGYQSRLNRILRESMMNSSCRPKDARDDTP